MVGVEKLHIEKMDKLVTITGSNGFIAKHLADRFTGRPGHKVASVPRELLTDPRNLKGILYPIKTHYIFHFATYRTCTHTKEGQRFSWLISSRLICSYKLLRM